MDDRDYRILQNKLKKKETCQDPCGRHIFSFDKNEKFFSLDKINRNKCKNGSY